MINCLLLCIVLTTIKPQVDAKNVCSFVRRQACSVWPRFSEKGNLTAMHIKGRNAKSRNLEIVHQVFFKKLILLVIFLLLKPGVLRTAVPSLSGSFKACVDISNLQI